MRNHDYGTVAPSSHGTVIAQCSALQRVFVVDKRQERFLQGLVMFLGTIIMLGLWWIFHVLGLPDLRGLLHCPNEF